MSEGILNRLKDEVWRNHREMEGRYFNYCSECETAWPCELISDTEELLVNLSVLSLEARLSVQHVQTEPWTPRQQHKHTKLRKAVREALEE